MKCCQARRRVTWLNGAKPTFREHRNVGLLDSQQPEAAASPRIFCRICKFNFLNDLYMVIHLKLYPVQKSVSCFFTEHRAHRTCFKCPLDLSTRISLNDRVSRDNLINSALKTNTVYRYTYKCGLNLKACRLSVYAASFSIFDFVIYCL
jgi:hypothetical protein